MIISNLKPWKPWFSCYVLNLSFLHCDKFVFFKLFKNARYKLSFSFEKNQLTISVINTAKHQYTPYLELLLHISPWQSTNISHFVTILRKFWLIIMKTYSKYPDFRYILINTFWHFRESWKDLQEGCDWSGKLPNFGDRENSGTMMSFH